MVTSTHFAGAQSAQPARLPRPEPSINVPRLAKPLTSDLFFKGRNTPEEQSAEKQIPQLARQCQKKGLNLQVLLNEATTRAAAENCDMQSVYVEILKQKLAESSAGSTPTAEVIKTPRRKLSNRSTSLSVPPTVPSKAFVKAISPPPAAIESDGEAMDTESDSTSPKTIIKALEKECKQKNIKVKDIQATAQAIVEAEGSRRKTKTRVDRQQTVYISLLREALQETQAQQERSIQLKELAELTKEAQHYGINTAELELKAIDKNNRSYDRGNVYHRDRLFIRYLKDALLELEKDADGDDDDFSPAPSHNPPPFIPQHAAETNAFQPFHAIPSRPFPEPAASNLSPKPLSFEDHFKTVTGFDLRANGFLK
jgi:hypothetical protein